MKLIVQVVQFDWCVGDQLTNALLRLMRHPKLVLLVCAIEQPHVKSLSSIVLACLSCDAEFESKKPISLSILSIENWDASHDQGAAPITTH